MSDEQFDRFKKCAVEVLSVDDAKITKEASFAVVLDADRLDRVEFVMALVGDFDITVGEGELGGGVTVGQAFELVSSKL